MLKSQAVWLLPWTAQAMYRAELAAVSGEWADIHEPWQNLASVASESARAALSLGRISLFIGQDNMATSWFEQTLSIEPTNLYASLGKALINGPWPAAGRVLCHEEARVTQLARTWAQHITAAGRHDLATRLHRLDTSDNQ